MRGQRLWFGNVSGRAAGETDSGIVCCLVGHAVPPVIRRFGGVANIRESLTVCRRCEWQTRDIMRADVRRPRPPAARAQ